MVVPIMGHYENAWQAVVRRVAAAATACGRAAMLVERVDAEAGEVRHREAEVALEVLFVHLPLRIAHDVVHHGVHVLVLHRRQVDPSNVAMNADHGRQARGKVQVGGLVLDGEGEELGDVHL
jgi:hypothetical protein